MESPVWILQSFPKSSLHLWRGVELGAGSCCSLMDGLGMREQEIEACANRPSSHYTFLMITSKQAPGRAFQLSGIYLEAEFTVFDICRIVFIFLTDTSEVLALRSDCQTLRKWAFCFMTSQTLWWFLRLNSSWVSSSGMGCVRVSPVVFFLSLSSLCHNEHFTRGKEVNIVLEQITPRSRTSASEAFLVRLSFAAFDLTG